MYTLKLIPCTSPLGLEYTIPPVCNPREPLTFDLDIRFQQVILSYLKSTDAFRDFNQQAISNLARFIYWYWYQTTTERQSWRDKGKHTSTSISPKACCGISYFVKPIHTNDWQIKYRKTSTFSHCWSCNVAVYSFTNVMVWLCKWERSCEFTLTSPQMTSCTWRLFA